MTMFNDTPDLTHAELFADSNRGIYIPQYFAQNVERSYVENVSDAEFTILIAGPEHDLYDEVWSDVLDNAVIRSPTLGLCHLYQDGDLWLVPTAEIWDGDRS